MDHGYIVSSSIMKLEDAVQNLAYLAWAMHKLTLELEETTNRQHFVG